MALDDDIRVLSGVALFEAFTREQLRLLAFGAENVRLAAGRVLYREGAPADCAFAIASGEVALFRERNGEQGAIGTVGPGSMLGELALIVDTDRLTSAATVAETDLIRINRRLFRRVLEEYPETAAALHARISENLRAMIAEIEKLGPAFA